MTDRELAAFRAGVRHAADMALVSALALELRDDAGAIRQMAAIEALRGLAEGLKAQSAHEAACPICAGRLAWFYEPGDSRWVYESDGGRIRARCDESGCLAVTP